MLNEVLLKAKGFLNFRKQSYEMVFKQDNRFVKEVMKDLAKFCRLNDSCFNPDPRIHAILEGRREVILRIMKHINLDHDQLWREYGRKDIE